MKYLLLILTLFTFGCKMEPEFYIDGKPYYDVERCVKSHTESAYGYHYGYNTFRGKYEYHMGHYTKTICDESKIDTIEIK